MQHWTRVKEKRDVSRWNEKKEHSFFSRVDRSHSFGKGKRGVNDRQKKVSKLGKSYSTVCPFCCQPTRFYLVHPCPPRSQLVYFFAVRPSTIDFPSLLFGQRFADSFFHFQRNEDWGGRRFFYFLSKLLNILFKYFFFLFESFEVSTSIFNNHGDRLWFSLQHEDWGEIFFVDSDNLRDKLLTPNCKNFRWRERTIHSNGNTWITNLEIYER